MVLDVLLYYLYIIILKICAILLLGVAFQLTRNFQIVTNLIKTVVSIYYTYLVLAIIVIKQSCKWKLLPVS